MKKLSATALVRAVQKGLISPKAAGKATKALKLKSRTIKEIGRGAESITQLRTSPEHGLMAAKIFNQRGPLYSQQMFDAKLNIAKNMSGKGNFAKLYGADKKRKIFFQEYSPGKNTPILTKLKSLKTSFKARKAGTPFGDVLANPGNTSGGKIIDFMPESKEVWKTTKDYQAMQQVTKSLKSFSIPKIKKSLKNYKEVFKSRHDHSNTIRDAYINGKIF